MSRPCPLLAPRWVFLAVVLSRACLPAGVAADGPAPARTAAQQKQLEERDQYTARARKLWREGKLVDAVAAAEKMLALERAVFGNVHDDVGGSLHFLAKLYALQGNAEAARKAGQEALDITTKLHGAKHWTADLYRLRLADGDRLAQMDAAQRRRLLEAEQGQEQGEELRDQGKYRDALPLLRRALATRKELLGDKHPAVGDSLRELAALANLTGDSARARALFQEADAIYEQSLGRRHPYRALALFNLGMLCQETGDYVRAEAAYRQALAFVGEAMGEKDRTYVALLRALAVMFDKKGEYARAEPLYRQVLEALEQTGREKEPFYATCLNDLGLLYRARGDSTRAEPFLKQALALRRQILGEKDPATIASLSNLGLLYKDRGDYARAEPVLEQVLEITRRVQGTRTSSYATSLDNLAQLYADKGEHARALPLIEEALAVRKQVVGEKHPTYATSLNNLAEHYESRGEYPRAEALLKQALAILKQALGQKHPAYATGLSNLGGVYWRMGDYARALPLIEESLAIRKQALGEKHPDYAAALHNLATLYRDKGAYAQAEPLNRQGLRLFGDTLGEKHPSYATALTSLGRVYRDLGDFARAEPLCRQALEIRKQVLGEKHPDYAQSLNNLAQLYEDMKAYDKAKPLFRQSVRLLKESLGEKHPEYAQALSNLAGLYSDTGDRDLALPLLEKARDLRKQTLGEKHPAYAESLNNLAMLYQEMGSYDRAEPLCRQTMGLLKEALGDKHPAYAGSVCGLAALCWAKGDSREAESLARRSLDLAREQLDLTFAVQSERQQLALTRSARHRMDAYLTLSLPAKVKDGEVYAYVLAWKGAVFARQRSVRAARHALRQENDPEAVRLYADLESTARQLATLALAPPGQQLDRRRQLQRLTDDKERLEAALAARSAAFRSQQPLTSAKLLEALPADVALVDFLEYVHFLLPKAGKGPLRTEGRLVAFVLRRGRPVVRVELGPSKPITAAVDRWREESARARAVAEKGAADPAAELRRRVWLPLQEQVGDAGLVLLSPDGPLCRFPLAALPGKEEGSYLLEERALAILPVPQLLPALLAPQNTEGARPSLLVVGEVDYGADPGSAGRASEARSLPGSARRGALFHWAELGATAAEVAAIKDRFQRTYRRAPVAELREEEPTEEAVRREAPGHRFLHLATHGFFAPPELKSALASASRGGLPAHGDLFGRQDVSGYHPGLLSGLVLAGANRPPQQGKDDGILTALEVAEMDLGGVELAVLSACETGLGRESGGEGLLGMQRAFQAAGARSVVGTLWRIDDKATQQLMADFYDNLWKRKRSKVEALRQAQLTMLREGVRGLSAADEPAARRRTPPYLWAAFVLSGDWR